MADDQSVAIELAKLSVKLDERERGASSFRQEIREGFGRVEQHIAIHSAEDTRRFEMASTALDEKVSGLYEHMQAQSDAQRTRAWQISGIVITAVLALAGVLITAHKSGIL